MQRVSLRALALIFEVVLAPLDFFVEGGRDDVLLPLGGEFHEFVHQVLPLDLLLLLLLDLVEEHIVLRVLFNVALQVLNSLFRQVKDVVLVDFEALAGHQGGYVVVEWVILAVFQNRGVAEVVSLGKNIDLDHLGLILLLYEDLELA